MRAMPAIRHVEVDLARELSFLTNNSREWDQIPRLQHREHPQCKLRNASAESK